MTPLRQRFVNDLQLRKFRPYGAAFLARHGAGLSTAQRRALHDAAGCRTAALGGHVQRCLSCAYEAIAYNSYCNRHGPK